MSEIVTALEWTIHQGTQLTATIRWLDENDALRVPTAVEMNIRDRPNGDVLLTLDETDGIDIGVTGICTVTIAGADSADLLVGDLPFDIVPTIAIVQDSADVLTGVLTVTRAMGEQA